MKSGPSPQKPTGKSLLHLQEQTRTLARRLAALTAALAGLLALAAGARAATPAVEVYGGAKMTGGTSYSVGWQFTLNDPVQVTALGVYDADGGGLAQGHTVRLYDVTNNQVLTTVTVPQAAPGESAGGYLAHYTTLPSPITLATGTSYLLAKQNGLDSYLYNTAVIPASQVNWITGKGVSGGLPAGASGFNIDYSLGAYFGTNFKFEAGTPPSATVALSKPTGRAVYQRDNKNSANVSVVGTYSGAVDRIEARAVARSGYAGTTTPWTVIDSSPGGGGFSSAINVKGGWYDVEVRLVKDSAPVASTAIQRVGVGEVFVTAGQSNSACFGSPQQQPDDDRVSALDVPTGAWQLANDPQPNQNWGGSKGSPWPQLGDLLAAQYGVPVGFISAGYGGASVSQWQPPGAMYNVLRDALQAAGPNGVRAVLWHQGESDSAGGTSTANYASLLQNIIAQSRTDAGWDLPWGVALVSYHPNATAANMAKVIAGQQMVIDADALVFLGAQTDDFHNLGYLSDSVHFNTLGLEAHAQQWADALAGIIPEPATLSLLALGAAAMLKRRTG